MNEFHVSDETYARAPTAKGQIDLRVRFFRPEDAGPGTPLLVWFHAGGFRTGSFDAAPHTRLARQLNRQGYATAFPQYRLRGRARNLSPDARALLPDLIADADRNAPEINPDFTGAAAITALEDAGAFLAWLAANGAARGFDGPVLLGGSSAGGMTVLNLLSLAPHLGIALPDPRTAFVMSGAFAYPSFFAPHHARVLALHGSREAQIPATPIRAYAARPDAKCTLLEDADHRHGDLRLTRAEPLRAAVRRMARFDRGAPLAPARTGGAAGNPVKDRHRICVVTCLRDEGPFLLEWIAHNRAIGVTDFIIFSNDCTDGSDALLQRLDAMGVVHHIRNPATPLKSDQYQALPIANAPFHKAMRRADYAILTDVDEFIQINTADRTLNGLIAAMGYPDVISLSELVFGFGGNHTYRDRLVTEQFRACTALPPDAEPARRGVKSIMRVMPGVALGNHRPHLLANAPEHLRWVDGRGRPVAAEFIAEGACGLDARGRYRLARVNHYALRSAESLLVKYQRDDAMRRARMNPRYLSQRDGRDAQDHGFDPHLPELKRRLADLMQDADLARLHADCVARHQCMIDRLKADPDFAEIWQAIRAQANRAPSDHPA